MRCATAADREREKHEHPAPTHALRQHTPSRRKLPPRLLPQCRAVTCRRARPGSARPCSMATILSAVKRDDPSATRRSTASAPLSRFTSAAISMLERSPTPVVGFGSMTPPSVTNQRARRSSVPVAIKNTSLPVTNGQGGDEAPELALSSAIVAEDDPPQPRASKTLRFRRRPGTPAACCRSPPPCAGLPPPASSPASALGAP